MTLKDVARTSNPSRLDDQIFPQPEGEIPMKAPVVAFGEIVGQSPAARGVLEQTEMVAPNDVTARFVGESGTGKKLLASAIDERSPRGEGPLVRVNCGSIPLNETKKSEAQFRRFIDTVPALLWCNLPDGSNEFLNQRWHEYAGLSPQESHGWGWQVAFHPEDLLKLLEKWQALLVSGEPGEIEARLRRFDGEYRWFLMRAQPVRDQRGDIVKWYGAVTDIEDRKRAESLLEAEKRSLEMIAGGAPLTDILENLCDTIDAQASGIISTAMLMDPDRQRLWPVAGRRVPKEWIASITPLTIGPRVGSCGTAAFRSQRVITSDIAVDPLWIDYRELALGNGLRAAWSEPLLSKDHQVLGTFAIYYREPRTPGESDFELIAAAGHIAVIAIEGERARAALVKATEEITKSEAQLRTIIDAIPQLITVLRPDGRNIYANQSLMEYTGLTREEVMADDFRARVFHPEDIERLREERQQALARSFPFQNEQRMRRKDGQYRWFLIQYNPLRDERGEVIRWYATGTDIEDRKQHEERARKENLALREEVVRSSMFEEIVGSSDSLCRVLAQVAKVAPTDSTILISGETGTGKELIARAIHQRSNRATRAFIAVNCAAIPQALIASELFGHEKGAFTGAMQRRAGRFEAADGGTILLDEVGELPMETQIALLRVLQERQFERIGSTAPVKADVRVIAATNKDLEGAVKAGTFRQDLFYRLNVFPMLVPPLREREGDIPLLVEYLIDRYSKKAGKKFTSIAKSTLELFQAYDWPGNIRELQNVIERAVILCDSEIFAVDETWLKAQPPSGSKSNPAVPLSASLTNRERELIEAALAESGGRVSGKFGAAAKLGIPRQTLESKISYLGIEVSRFRTA
jgi:PAS domain S-box-containing protein